jgi:multidrug resistance efflux pump
MIRPSECAVFIVLLLAAGVAGATVFSGEVRMAGSQSIDTPPSTNSPVVLRYFVADGQPVKAGDVLLRIDAGQAETQLRKQQSDLVQATAKNAKELAELQLKQSDAELALADARAERDTAAVDAAIPRSLESALNFDRYRSEMQRTDRALAVKTDEVRRAAEAVARRRQDGALDLQKQGLSLAFSRDQVAQAVVHADRDGTVVHGFDNVFGNGGRYEEGSSSYPGQSVGQVVGSGNDYTVHAWVLEPDRAGLHAGQPVWLDIDALPGPALAGRIQSVSGASTTRTDWGDGRYFEVEIALPAGVQRPLRPGMSVRVDTALEDGTSARAGAIDTASFNVEGEIYAQQSLAISPPAVDGLWQMTVTQMAGDGETVKKGGMLVVFDSNEVTKNLTAKRGELAEKLRKQVQTRLDLADRAREAELATAQAQADLEKAQRKANQPEQYIARVDYSKLVIARSKAESKLALTSARERVAAEERTAEQQMADADVIELQHQVDALQRSLASLTVTAPRAGIVLHESGWDGNKVDTGTQVWMGQSVAQMPDLATLAVRAALPERQLPRVRAGERVRVVIAGGGDRSVDGRIARIGGNVHSKSRVEAVPVVDLVVQLDPSGLHLKPGQSVRVEFPAGAEVGS